jgi:hypothetical protein
MTKKSTTVDNNNINGVVGSKILYYTGFGVGATGRIISVSASSIMPKRFGDGLSSGQQWVDSTITNKLATWTESWDS